MASMQGGFRLARSEEEEEEEEEVRRSRTLPRRGGRGGQRSPPTVSAGRLGAIKSYKGPSAFISG